MITIKLTTCSPSWDFVRQTPKSFGVWGDCQFFVNNELEEYDYWVVYEGLSEKEQVKCSINNTILITGEPSSIKTYPKKYLAQFGAIITSHKNLKHPNVINTQQSLPWMIGGRFLQKEKIWAKEFTKSYDELKTIQSLPKPKLLSVISSNKTNTKGHRQRLKFVEALQKEFGDSIDIFGRGLKDFEDKWEVIAPYKYHIVIENSSHEDYWTEKLSDCFLAGAYPFYYGCPNLADYFPKQAYTSIDINNVEEAIMKIKQGIEEKQFEASYSFLDEAKDLVLDKYNLFASISNYISQDKNGKIGEKQFITLKPEKIYNRGVMAKLNHLKRIIKNKI